MFPPNAQGKKNPNKEQIHTIQNIVVIQYTVINKIRT